MRTSISTLIFTLISVLLFAQNENPYSQFVYEAPIMPERNLPFQSKFLLINADTTSVVGALIIDPSKRLMTVFDKHGSVLKDDTVSSYTVARWLSPDPYGQFTSPYIGMGNNPVSGMDPDGGFVGGTTLLEEVTIMASRLPSVGRIIDEVTMSLGRGLLSNSITSSFKPNDEVHYNTQTNKFTIKTTDKNYDEMFVDGKRVGYSMREGWKVYALDAVVFGEHSLGFYSAAYGALLRNENVFARLYRNASSQVERGALFQATIANRDPTILYGTLAMAAAPIVAGELLGAAAGSEIASSVVNVSRNGTRVIGIEKKIMFIKRAAESSAKGNRYLRSIKYWSETGGKKGLGGWKHFIDW